MRRWNESNKKVCTFANVRYRVGYQPSTERKPTLKSTNIESAPRFFLKQAPVQNADEVRASVRFPLHLPVSLETEGSSPVQATTENISASGLLLTVDRELPPDSHIEFSIKMPAAVLGTATDILVHGTGRVVRCYTDSSQTRAAAVIDDYTLEAAPGAHDTPEHSN